MGTQSKKIDKTKAKDRKNGLQLVLWDHFLFKFKRVAFEFNFY